MRHALAIFRKDVRHLWPRIAIVLAIDLFVGWFSFATPPGLQDLRPPLRMIETLALWYLIASVIHQEAVPGDRQYWLTRPFSRLDLLGAKLIFILVFLCLPLFLGHVASLLLRGISPLTYLPEMLVCQLFFLASAALPVAAWASVTAGLVEFVGFSLAAFVGYIVIISLVASRAQNDFYWVGLVWFHTTEVASLTLAAAVAVLLLQYFRRRLWLSRSILATAVVLSALPWWAPGWDTAFALQTRLSEVVAGSVARIIFDPARDPRTSPPSNSSWQRQDVGPISIPVRVTGIPAGMALYSDRARVTVGTPNGRKWKSDWDSMNALCRVLSGAHAGIPERFLPGDGEYWLCLNIDRSIYLRASSEAIHLRARVALTLLSPEQITPLALRPGVQAIPHDGVCWVTRGDRLLKTDCSWPARAPADFNLRLRPGGPWPRPSWDSGVSYATYPTSEELWQWSGQAVTLDTPPVGIDVATRKAVAHFERDLDIPDLREWTNR